MARAACCTDGPDRIDRSIDMIALLTVVLTILVSGSNSNATIAEVFEVRTLAPTHHYDGYNLQFEDGSYIYTPNEASLSVAGCMPFRLCSWVQIDTPWEDILDSQGAEIMYKLTRIAKLLD